ncbi:MAG: AAA family ATPase [Hoylesella marshii]|uniref:AAA family ATPase n=1 Tax=Hoylesella marshii TaxID=189722 RepID=UPI003F9FF40A
MYIYRVKLFNWKNFHDCEVKMSERSFIIGANATGKSNFLDALRFLRDIVNQGGGLQAAITSRGGLKKIRCLAARKKTNVRIEVDLAENGKTTPKWKYAIDLTNTGGGIRQNTALIREEDVFNYESNKSVLHRTEKTAGEDTETRKYTHLEQPTANAPFREIKEAFATIEYLNVVPQLVREANSIMMTSGKEDYYGRNFLERMSLLNTQTRKKYLRFINEILLVAIPQLEELEFIKDERGVPHIEARYKHWRAKGSKQNEKMFSDGTLRLIGFLFAILDGTGIILFEEPETNLHAAIIKRIPEFVARMQRSKKRQIIITTHSYEILSNEGIGANELIVLINSQNGTIVQSAEEMEAAKHLMNNGFTAADVAANDTKPQNIEKMNDVVPI